MKLYDTVKSLLTKYPGLRDNDKRLIWAIYYHQGIIDNGHLSRDKFYNEAETPESITRARRMVQERFPELAPSPIVAEMRKEKASQKGTHIFREEIGIPFEAKLKLFQNAKEELIKKGILLKST